MSTYYTLACPDRRVRIERPGGPDYWLGRVAVPADGMTGDPVTADILRAGAEEYIRGEARGPYPRDVRKWLTARVERLIAAMGPGDWRLYCDAGYGCVNPELKAYEEIGGDWYVDPLVDVS